jgi:hypothetical protein
MQAVTTIGLDIAKSVLQIHGIDAEGKVIIRRRLKRRFVIGFFRKLPACLVGLEEMRVVASLVALKASHNDLGSRCSAVIVTAASQRRSADAPNRS